MRFLLTRAVSDEARAVDLSYLWRDQFYRREVVAVAANIAGEDGPLHVGGVRADVEIREHLALGSASASID